MKLSVGIPFFNAEKTLAYSIQSVLTQTYSDWELFLMDDGSTDRSLQIAEAFAAKDSRIQVASDGENRKLSFRLNQIAHLATGKYLARMDADDVMHPERLQRQIDYLDSHPDVHIVSSGAYIIDDQNRVLGCRHLESLKADLKSILSEGRHVLHPTIMGYSSWFQKNPYDGAFPRSEDYELWCRTCHHTVFHNLGMPLLFYRGASVRLNDYLSSLRTSRKIIRLYGATAFDRHQIRMLSLKAHMKGIVARLITWISLESLLTIRRNTPISDSESKVAQAVLTKIVEQADLVESDVYRMK